MNYNKMQYEKDFLYPDIYPLPVILYRSSKADCIGYRRWTRPLVSFCPADKSNETFNSFEAGILRSTFA